MDIKYLKGKGEEYMYVVLYLLFEKLKENKWLMILCFSRYIFILFLQTENLQMIQKESDAILSTYGHFFDVVHINNDVDESVKGVEEAMEQATSTPQWVPISWVYWRPPGSSSIQFLLSKGSAISLLPSNLWVSSVFDYLVLFAQIKAICREDNLRKIRN